MAKLVVHRRKAAPTTRRDLRLSSETLYGSLVESLTEFAIFAVSPDGRIISWNPGAQRAFGLSKEDAIGADFGIIFTPEDRAAGAPAWELRVAKEVGRVDRERWHARKDGSRFWAANIMQPIYEPPGTLAGFSKIVRDRTESYASSESLRLSEERLRLLFESVSNYALFSVGTTGTITFWNHGAQEVFGYAADEMLGSNFAKLYCDEDARRAIPQSQLDLAGSVAVSVDERWHVRKDGSRFFASVRINRMSRAAEDDRNHGFVVIAHDITQRKAREDAMRHQTSHDQLTGLPNRDMFLEHLRRTIAHAKRHLDGFAVLFLDVDNFKVINDTLGHNVADLLLKELAVRLQLVVRDEDVVARLSGDEFAILVTGLMHPRDAEALADRLHGAIALPFLIDDREVLMTASVGISVGSPDHEYPEDALRDADIAMYAAKARGRANHMVFNPAMHARVVERHRVEMDLRNALERDELRIVYQPIVDLKTTRTVGFEALVRWEHPTRGLLLPEAFLSVAHSTGMIIAIDRWVLLNACRSIGSWQAGRLPADTLTLSVNLSAKQFMREDLVPFVAGVLEETQLDGSLLKLEITEDTIMEQSETVIATILRLRDLNVNIYIDDFGTGYSSLSYLADLPVTMLKIDRSFVHRMMAQPRYADIIATIVRLAQDLGLGATAEGIETAQELSALKVLGCGFGQGYLFSRPVDWNAATAMLPATLAMR
jgi:diguanylate cyclase (GGDEF)-like protein/PAS domain S-box-containing protein